MNTEVLIVGAGPTGLFLANELARYGISFRIIDKKTEPTKTSNAAGIQTRTLEIFSDLGMIELFLEQGVHCKRTFFKYKNKTLLSFDLTQLDSIFKFLILIPQCKTEEILTRHLEQQGHHIERGQELEFLKESDDYVEAKINGKIEHYHWVVGCDGAHSTVRQQCNINFPGEDIENKFIVADIKLTGIKEKDAITAYTGEGSAVAIFPLGNDHYRIAANFKKGKNLKEISDHQIKDIIKQRIGIDVKVEAVSWASPFWIHSKLVPQMRKGRIFLAGDAAHIHSPIGGQGMNTGLQDAYNLAWKLAFVIQGKASYSLLDSYEKERWPVIQKIVKTTERSTHALVSTNPLFIFLRNLLLRFLNTQGWLKKKVLMQLTQLSIRYLNSPDIDYDSVTSNDAPKPGARAPDIMLDNGQLLHSNFDRQKYNILVFSGTSKSIDDNQTTKEMISKEESKLNHCCHIIFIEVVHNNVNALHDEHSKIHQLFGITKPSLIVLRPDNIIQSTSEFNMNPVPRLKSHKYL